MHRPAGERQKTTKLLHIPQLHNSVLCPKTVFKCTLGVSKSTLGVSKGTLGVSKSTLGVFKSTL